MAQAPFRILNAHFAFFQAACATLSPSFFLQLVSALPQSMAAQ
jgi:hypothetical protein